MSPVERLEAGITAIQMELRYQRSRVVREIWEANLAILERALELAKRGRHESKLELELALADAWINV